MIKFWDISVNILLTNTYIILLRRVKNWQEYFLNKENMRRCTDYNSLPIYHDWAFYWD